MWYGGGIHGFYQIAEDAAGPVVKRLCRIFHADTGTFSWKLFGILGNFILVDIAWVFFRADTVHAALRILSRAADISNIGLLLNGGLYQLGLNERNMMILFIGLLALLISGLMAEKGINVLAWLSGQNIVFRYILYWGAIVLIIFSLDITGQEFIYFQF